MIENARRDLYRILGGILERCPDRTLLEALASDPALESLAAHFGRQLGEALRRMHADVRRGGAAHDAIRRDFVRLFVGPKKKLAPPWESVYRSPERLVMQVHEREVVKAYAAQRVGFDGMGTERPADHIALELQFMAILLERAGHRRAATEALRRFLDQHVLRWVPAFAADVTQNARTDFLRAVGQALTAICAMEAGRPSPKRLPVVGGV